MGERTLEAAYHEAGHLVVIDYLFSANEHFRIDFATILPAGDSGGGIGWHFGDNETDEDRRHLCAVLMAGTFYERSLSKTTPEDRLQIHFSGDSEKIIEFGLTDLIDDAAIVLQEPLEAVAPIVMLVAKELSQRKTFYTGESALVLRKYRAVMEDLPDFIAIDRELQDYRRTRAYAMNPPDTWKQCGTWRESLDAWRARALSRSSSYPTPRS